VANILGRFYQLDRRRRQTIIYSVVAGFGIILILGAFLAFRSTEPMRLHEDRKSGFSLLVPKTWEKKIDFHGAALSAYSPVENELDWFLENINVVVQDISSNPLSLDEYSELAIRQVEVVFKENVQVLKAKSARFAGRPGYMFNYIGKGPQGDVKIIHFWTLDGLTAYQFTYTAIVPDFDKYWPTAKKMMKSFKIL